MTFNNTTIANELYPVANGTTSSNPFVVQFLPRDPTVYDVQYPIQKLWLNTSTDNFWFLKNLPSSNGITLANWIPLSSASVVETVTGDDGIVVIPVANNINFLANVVANGTHAKPIFFRSGGNPNEELDVQVSVASASSSINNAGIASFNSNNFTVDANGFVSSIGLLSNYTNVVGPITYVVLPTDYYISCNSTAGAITLNFPNAPTFKQNWIVKDRTGTSFTNNITLTTPGGITTFDGQASLIMDSNYIALNVLANATPTYEVY